MSRRQLIRHAAWFGAAVVLTVAGGEVISHVAAPPARAHTRARPTLRFAQISDSHIGFTGPANTDVTGTFTEAIDQVNALGYTPRLRHPHRRPDPPVHTRTSSTRSSRC